MKYTWRCAALASNGIRSPPFPSFVVVVNTSSERDCTLLFFKLMHLKALHDEEIIFGAHDCVGFSLPQLINMLRDMNLFQVDPFR